MTMTSLPESVPRTAATPAAAKAISKPNNFVIRTVRGTYMETAGRTSRLRSGRSADLRPEYSFPTRHLQPVIGEPHAGRKLGLGGVVVVIVGQMREVSPAR